MANGLVNLSAGAQGLFVKNMRFNTTLISFNFYLPIVRETVAESALLPFILTTCSKAYPDFSRLNYKLNKLYGAELSASAEKLGDYQLLRMSISVIDDSFTLDGEPLCATAAKMLTDMIFEPMVENGAFLPEDVEREKRKAIEHIRGEVSDKRTYSKRRLIEEMYSGEAYGLPKCGTEQDVEAVTGESLYKAWQNMISKAFVRVHIISRNQPAGVFDAISERFNSVDRGYTVDVNKTIPTAEAKKTKRVTEKMDIAQGKLVMGFSTKAYGADESSLAMTVAGDIFGGGTYSKLFTNVREKMSLCYYCTASTVRIKGLMTVESGVEAGNADRAEKEILAQLKAVKSGEFTDGEFEASIKSNCDSVSAYEDSQQALDNWYAARFRSDNLSTPAQIVEDFRKLTREDVLAAAVTMKLNTVYKLMPKGEDEQ